MEGGEQGMGGLQERPRRGGKSAGNGRVGRRRPRLDPHRRRSTHPPAPTPPSLRVFTMGESRTELIAWLNELLQINYTKVEQCGTGAAYCQVIDSIFGQSSSLPALRMARW